MNCKICSCQTEEVFSKKVLGKFSVSYYRCSNCQFIQTEEPYWLDEAYSTGAISALDTGIIYRNLFLRGRTKNILLKLFKDFSEFKALDYGGGEGIYVRMMRDLGFNFFRQDFYADNLYARFFDFNDLPKETKFNILTAFEVFEHLTDPLTEIKKLQEYSDILLFSTELQPSKEHKELENWWYIVPETGQHISFYNESSLNKIAELLNLKFYTDHINLHILSKKELDNPFKTNEGLIKKPNLFKRIINKIHFLINRDANNLRAVTPSSLTMKDFELVKRRLNTQQNHLK